MKKILVVEDELDVRRNLEDLLEAEGFDILSAEDGKEGYEIAIHYEPDLILSDIRMPKMDGLELLKKLQENSKTSIIPFIFLTAKTENTDVRQGMVLGADDYILKPFKITDVLNAINSRLRKNERYLSEVKEFKNILIKRVPHELRTPLVSILGLSGIMQDDIDNLSKEEINEMALRINRSGKRLYRRIEKFLTYSELLRENQNNNIGVNKTSNEYEVDPDLVYGKLLQKAEEFGRKADLNIQFEKRKIKIAEWHFDTVLDELIENSLKYSKKGSQILVIGKSNEDNYVTKIIDNGIGTINFDLNKINTFNQFGKEDNTEEGLGMGLAIVKKIVDLSNGYITIESIYNSSSTVEIGIPLVLSKDQIFFGANNFKN